ncbi:MAG: ATP-binding cassette domain-containing protein, partial [Bacteroidales bacterium]
MHSYQDAKISFERLGEIHSQKEEEPVNEDAEQRIATFPFDKSIRFSNVKFQYDRPHGEIVLKDVNAKIPENKITAIVGTSGSGKTTMVKLMLGFYDLVKGDLS